MEEQEQSFRDFLLEWMERRDFTQARLADATGIAQSLISKHMAPDERKRVRPSPENLERYAGTLGVPYEDLLQLCGYLPGKAELGAKDEIERDVQARTAELMAAVRGAPPAFWEPMIRATFDMATGYARNMAEFLKNSESQQSKPTAGKGAQPRGAAHARTETHSQGRSRRNPNLDVREFGFALAG